MTRKTGLYSAARVSSDFLLDVASGRVSGWSHVNKFGANSDADIGNEDITELGGDYSGFLTTASTVEIFSASANDTVAGTGARTVEIQGLDPLYAPQSEIVDTDGTSVVLTGGTFLRGFRLKVKSGGTIGSNDGIITARASDGGGTLGNILVGHNQSLLGIYTVPANKRGLITNIWYSLNTGTGTNAQADGSMFIRPFGEVFQLKFKKGLSKTLSPEWPHKFKPALTVEPKSDIKLRALGIDTNDTKISAGFDIVLRDI